MRSSAGFRKAWRARIVNLRTGEYADDIDAISFDQRAASRDPSMSREAPDNPAKVRRLPELGLVFVIKENGGAIQGIILPVEGMGLWSVALRLSGDRRRYADHSRALTFYQHAETAGLGGEVDNPRWKALWPGRLAFDASWLPKIAVKKGPAGPVGEDPYQVDGLSGSTLTSERRDPPRPVLDRRPRLRTLPREAAVGKGGSLMAKPRDVLLDPLFDNNPIALQVLGICSALPVTTKLEIRRSS